MIEFSPQPMLLGSLNQHNSLEEWQDALCASTQHKVMKSCTSTAPVLRHTAPVCEHHTPLNPTGDTTSLLFSRITYKSPMEQTALDIDK